VRREFYGGPLDGEVREVPREWRLYITPALTSPAFLLDPQYDPAVLPDYSPVTHDHRYTLCESGHFHYDGDES